MTLEYLGEFSFGDYSFWALVVAVLKQFPKSTKQSVRLPTVLYWEILGSHHDTRLLKPSLKDILNIFIV